MALRSCTVFCKDTEGVEHSVEVTAESVFEAVGLALTAFKSDTWATELPGMVGDLRIVVRQLAVEHIVPISKFKSWLAGTSRSPRERIVRERIKRLMAAESQNQD